MSGKPNDENRQNEWTWIILTLLAAFAVWVSWAYARVIYVYPLYASDWIQIRVIEFLRSLYGSSLGDTGQRAIWAVQSVFDGRRDANTDVSWAEFYWVRTAVGEQTSVVIVALIAALAAIVHFRMKGDGFRRKFSLAPSKKKKPNTESLSAYAAQYWRPAGVSLTFEPDGVDVGVDPAYTPMEWLKANNITFENGLLDHDAARECFVKQLGDPWKGLAKTDPIVRAILIACGLHLLRTKENKGRASEALLGRINDAWLAKRDATDDLDALTAPYMENKKLVEGIDRVCGRHAYTNVAVFSMMEKAKKLGGVFPSSYFVWLRRIDRALWYTVNSVGRRKFTIEAACVVNHFFAEHVSEGPLSDPRVDEAIDGIEVYMEKEGLTSREEFFRKPKDEFGF